MSPYESAQQEEQSADSEESGQKSRESNTETDYSKEFEPRMLVVEAVDPTQYTTEMRDEDLAYLKEWSAFEFHRFTQFVLWHSKEVARRSREHVRNSKGSFEENMKVQEENLRWQKETWDTFQESHQKEEGEIRTLRRKVVETFKVAEDARQSVRDSTDRQDTQTQEKHGPEDQEKEEEKTGEPKEEPKTNREKPPKEERKETFDAGKIEEQAIRELGISRDEYKILTGRINTLPTDHLWVLLKSVLKVEDTGAKSMRTAYYELVKVLHPDTGGTEFEKAVKSAKIQVVNNLYGEYKKRYK